MAVKGFRKYDTKGNVVGIEKYDYNSLENLPNIDNMINEAISKQTHWRFQKVSALPTTGDENIIYLVPNTDSTNNNVYDEFIWIASENKFEIIGSTAIDLSNFYMKNETYSQGQIDEKVNKLEKGKVNNPISAEVGQFLVVKAVDENGVPTEMKTVALENISDGEDGVGIESVVQTTTATTDGGENVITVTLTDGTKSTFKVKNGTKGSDGKNGNDGSDGADGVSPTVKTTAISGGTRVTITDANGEKTFDVMNGQNGKDGKDGKDGANASDTDIDYSKIEFDTSEIV